MNAKLSLNELRELMRDFPVALWSLGLLEPHGQHLPVGFDGLKA